MKDDNYIFHVHTYRCTHASEDSDEAYVLAAISLGAKSIVFTDHAPFPDDLFGNRMRSVQLQEYISSLKSLKSRFKTSIDVRIGLEIEFLPSYLPYYFVLKDNADIDILMIGQHFFEIRKGYYSFALPDRSKEYQGLSEAICAGIETGLFNTVAHPDRIFRHQGEEWTVEMSKLSEKIINLARERNVLLEKNFCSMQQHSYYRAEFWEKISDEEIIYGCDAHNVKELVLAATIKRQTGREIYAGI